MDAQGVLSLLDRKFGIATECCTGGSVLREFAEIDLGFRFRYLGELFRYKLVQVRGTVTTWMSVALISNRPWNLPSDSAFLVSLRVKGTSVALGASRESQVSDRCDMSLGKT